MTFRVTGGLALIFGRIASSDRGIFLPKAIQNWKQKSGCGKAGSIITGGANDDYHPPPTLQRLFVQDLH